MTTKEINERLNHLSLYLEKYSDVMDDAEKRKAETEIAKLKALLIKEKQNINIPEVPKKVAIRQEKKYSDDEINDYLTN
jgi:hypothetical protein